MHEKKSVAVLLVNLGSPEEPTPKSVRQFLKAFLSDPRVVEFPIRIVWWLILNGIILRFRPTRVAKAYKGIWWEGGSPIRVILNRQVSALKNKLSKLGYDQVIVESVLTYGEPSFNRVVSKLVEQQGVESIVVLPLYPQYSATTTGSVWDQLAKQLQRMRNIPAVHFIKDYHDHPLYIGALAEKIQSELDSSEHLVFSFHGIPQAYADAGDPYSIQCQKTANLVAEKLNLDSQRYTVAFQSRFGKQEWLKPYLDKTLEAYPGQGIKNIRIVCPAFSADCLETLEEVAVENQHLFKEAGGMSYHYVEALNDDQTHIDMMFELIKPYLPKITA